MTLEAFEERCKKIDPTLNIRKRGKGDIVGLFKGSQYIVRLTLGEFNLNGYRLDFYDDNFKLAEGRIMKRGRKTVVKMMQKYVPLTMEQRASLLWGV